MEQYVKKKPKGKNILHETIDYINCTPTTPAPWHKYQGTQYKFDQDYSTREAQRRHFSHATKSRIFKNLNLRKKADLNFRGKFLKNHFRHLKLYSNPPSWLARSRCHMGTFWKTKDISERANLSGFGTWNFTAKEDLNPPKQVFVLNLRLWPTQKPKIWSFFSGKSFIWENFVVWKLGAFGLKISTLPRLLVVAIRAAWYLVAFTTMA